MNTGRHVTQNNRKVEEALNAGTRVVGFCFHQVLDRIRLRTSCYSRVDSCVYYRNGAKASGSFTAISLTSDCLYGNLSLCLSRQQFRDTLLLGVQYFVLKVIDFGILLLFWSVCPSFLLESEVHLNPWFPITVWHSGVVKEKGRFHRNIQMTWRSLMLFVHCTYCVYHDKLWDQINKVNLNLKHIFCHDNICI